MRNQRTQPVMNRRTVFTATLLLLTAVVPAQAPTWLWANGAGGPEEEEAEDIAVDAAGNTVVVGGFESATLTLGSTTLTNGGAMDLFIVKYDPNGNVLWAVSAGQGFDDGAQAVDVDASGNWYVSGFFESGTLLFGSVALTNSNPGNGDVFVVKFDPDGNTLWARSAGGPEHDESSALAVDGSGTCHMTGYWDSPSITFDAFTLTNATASSEILVVRYDAVGNATWATSAGGSGDDYGRCIATDGAGNTYVGGRFESPSITFGSSTLTNTGTGPDLFVVKIDAGGNTTWSASNGGSGVVDVRGITVDATDNVHISGSFDTASLTFGSTTLTNAGPGEEDIYVAKYDASGNVIWATSAGGAGDDRVRAMALSSTGTSSVVGYYLSTAITFGATTLTNSFAGEGDIYVAGYDDAGSAIWALSVGSTGGEVGHGVAVDAAGNSYLAGYFNSPSITVGGTTLTNAGTDTDDFFTAKLDAVTSVQALEAHGPLSVSPVPSSGIVHIEHGFSEGELTIEDAFGRVIHRTAIDGPRTVVDLTHQPAGTYSISIRSRKVESRGRAIRL